MLTLGEWPQSRTCRAVVGLIGALALLLALAAFSKPWPGQVWEVDTRPNIVLIFVDDLGYNDVSYNGATEIETPNIDRLAEEGVIFSSGYVAHPTCGPSRAGLVTGRHPARFGMEVNLAYAPFDDQYGLPVEERTIAAYLRDTGYRTGLVGKWQLGAAPPFHPLNRGFDYFYGFLGGEHDYFTVDTTLPGIAYLPLNYNRGADRLDGYLTDALTNRAVEFVNHAAPEPFFLYLAYNAPHTPIQAPRDLVHKYAHIDDPDRRTYLAMIDSLDQNVGRVVAALEESGQRDNTIIFFLSDNGGVYPKDEDDIHAWADNAPFSKGKNSFSEGGIRVPFVASWPARWPQGVTFEPMVSSLDIAATALGLAGGAAIPGRPLDGVNLDPYLAGGLNGAPHEALFWRLSESPSSPGTTRFAVRSGRVKLVKNTSAGEAQLFDLELDPGETRNLIDSDTETAVYLAGLWNAWNRENPSINIYTYDVYYQSEILRSANKLAGGLRLREEGAQHFYALTSLMPPGTWSVSCSNGIAVTRPKDNPGLVGDCDALMAAKDTLAGGASLNWDYTVPIQAWEGVSISGEPRRVRNLHLVASGLEGSIPPQLGELDGLVKVSLSRNRLTGPIPPELGDMANLEELWLRDNLLTGTVPPELGNLGELELIRLGGNGLTGCLPASLRSISDNDFARLGLAYCEDDSVSEEEEPPSQVQDRDETLPATCSNGIAVTRPGDNPGLVDDCAALMAAKDTLAGGGSLNWDYAVPIYSWEGVFISGESGEPRRVRNLHLVASDIKGSIPPQLGGLDGLVKLSLSRNRLTGPIPPELGDLANLEELWLRDNLLTGTVPPELGNLGELELIRLGGNELTGCLPASLRSIVNNDFAGLELAYCDADGN